MIVQITATDTELYGLDEAGVVFYWNTQMNNWTELGQ
jgi:hypothetical protein